jgi:hypothetical protein
MFGLLYDSCAPRQELLELEDSRLPDSETISLPISTLSETLASEPSLSTSRREILGDFLLPGNSAVPGAFPAEGARKARGRCAEVGPGRPLPVAAPRAPRGPPAPGRGRRTAKTSPQRGTWCSGITPAQHAGGPGFNPQCVHGLSGSKITFSREAFPKTGPWG